MRIRLNKGNIQKIFGLLLITQLCLNCEKDAINEDASNSNLDTNKSVETKEWPNNTTATELNSCPEGFWYDWNCYDNYTLSSWGLGSNQSYYTTCDKNYDWYIDQGNTGVASESNCGPSSVTMACLWFDKDFSYSAEDARNVYPKNNGWWYTNDITNYLNLRSVPQTVYEYENPDQIIDLLNNGKIIIACLNMGKISYTNNSSYRLDRFYRYSSGHFLVIKGARIVDGEIFLEVYDPNNWNTFYNDDQSEKGKNRHYRAEDLSRAISQWWNYLIVVSPESQSLKNTDSKYKAVDPDKIETNYGR